MRPRPISILLLLAFATPALGDAIHLRRFVRMLDSDTVRLRDIARLEGPGAIAMAEVAIATISPTDRSPLELKVIDIRNALGDQDVHWGRVELNGGTVIVRGRPTSETGPPLAMQGLDILVNRISVPERSTDSGTHLAGELIGLDTLRGWLTRSITAELGVSPTNLQLIFNDGDAGMLDDRGRFEARPINDFKLSKRCDFNVRRWDGGKPGVHRVISIKARILANTVHVHTEVPRGKLITKHVLEQKEQWLSPLEQQDLVPLASAIGLESAAMLRAGTVLRQRHLQMPIVIRRGDKVNVDCLVGGGVLSTQAVAVNDAAAGDMIELRKGRERETFTARAVGPGKAVLDQSNDSTSTGTLVDASRAHSGAMP